MDDDNSTYTITFPGKSAAEANRDIERLRESVLDAEPSVSAEIAKSDTTTQDFGASLILVLGAPAVVAVARGIAAFIARSHATLEITSESGELVFRGDSFDAAQIVEALK